MNAPRTVTGAAASTAAPSAVVWINRREALVAAMSPDGGISICEIGRGWLSESAYLGRVASVIGDRQRVLILGPNSARHALERRYVAVFDRPGRLVDVEPAGSTDADALIDRLRTLAAG